MIKTDDILTRTTTYDILEFYTRDVRKGKTLKPMDNFQNPLISRTQKTPSFNVSYWKDAYYYKDYATGHSGSAFDLVMNLYGLDIKQACNKINEDMGLGLDGEHVEAERQYKPEPQILPDTRNYDFSVKPKPFNKNDKAFWGQYGITERILRMYECFPISEFHAYNKENKPYQIKARFDNPLYFYQRNGWGMVYRPLSKYTNRFYNIGKKPDGYLFGLEQLPQSGERLYFVGGEKDVMSMRAHSYYAVCFNSEEADPANYPDFLQLVSSSRFGEYIFMYDNDRTGVRNMENNALRFGIQYTVLPNMGEGRKDISDFFFLRRQKLVA
jgi:hypothetical protein